MWQGMVPVKKSFAVWYSWKDNRGFFLLQLQLSLAAAAFLGALLCTFSVGFLREWREVRSQTNLRDTGRYILSALEKELGYESVSVNIYRENDGKDAIKCESHYGNKAVAFLWKTPYLYKRTKTGSGIGTNPLYVNGYYVKDWKVKRVSEKLLLISFFLEKNSGKHLFRQLVYCGNGLVNDAEM